MRICIDATACPALFRVVGGVLIWAALQFAPACVQAAEPARLAFAEQLGFDTSPSGALGRLSAIVVGEVRYPIISLVRIEAPNRSKKP